MHAGPLLQKFRCNMSTARGMDSTSVGKYEARIAGVYPPENISENREGN